MAAIAQMERDAERARVAQARAAAQAQRAAVRAQAAYQRARAADERERKKLYVEARAAEVTAANDALARRIEELDRLLVTALSADPELRPALLKQPRPTTPFSPGSDGQPAPPPRREQFMPPAPSGLGRVFGPTAKQAQQVRQGELRFEQAVQEHRVAEQQREERVEHARRTHEARMEQVRAENRRQAAEVDALFTGLASGAPEAVVTYLDLVLQTTSYPEGFPHQWRLAFVPDSKQLVIEYELPGLPVVPDVKAYRYVRASDTVTETARPAAQIRTQYASVVAQTALRVVRDVLAADRAGAVDTVVLNGMVSTNDPATGQAIRPCLLTLRTTRDRFDELDLAHVDPAACLRHLGAGVSRSPAELAPVRPVLEFDMVDPRFIAEDDVLGGLDEQPNLLELTPSEFEGLIQNLFTRMGLETRQTRASRDGGVDCIAYNLDPILGGKVVIQAKRYRHTVGVSAVRDLYGTLQNEGASKGILVTTSSYGPASYDFAANKPIELLDGANLLYLLKEHAGIDARIQAPDGWTDPAPDTSDPLDDPSPSPEPEPAGDTTPPPETQDQRVAASGPPSSSPQAVQPASHQMLTAGQNVTLNTSTVRIQVAPAAPDTPETLDAALDLSVLLVTADGSVRGDDDFVFYNNPRSTDGSVQLDTPTDPPSNVSAAHIDLEAVDGNVQRLILAVSSDQPGQPLPPVTLQLHDAAVAAPPAFAFSTTTAQAVTTMLCGELYRRGGSWRLRAIGQGYEDGLAGLARDFGVDVDQ